MIESGRFGSLTELAEAERINRSASAASCG